MAPTNDYFTVQFHPMSLLSPISKPFFYMYILVRTLFSKRLDRI